MLSFVTDGRVRAAAMLVALLMLPACTGTQYLDNSIGELTPAEKVSVADPQPVQVLYEFQTKGVANGQATDYTKEMVADTIKSSGLFSQVSTDPVPNGALLHIVINNVPLDDAFAKGFVTGLTLGLAGSTVGDGYVCNAEYLPAPKTPEIDANIRDAIYTSIGATNGPQNATQMPDIKTAVQTMVHRVVSHMLNDLAKDPKFAQKASAPVAAAPAPAQPSAAPPGSNS